MTKDLNERAERWRADLDSWAIPEEILAQVSTPPWIHPVAMFTVADEVPDSLSHRRAREVLTHGGSVLDVGSGGGRASFALVPPAGTVVAVDHQQGMLDEFASSAVRRGLVHHEYLGDWPAVADNVPECDVVVCHHVAFNVAEIVPFLQALNDHAINRVVIEIPTLHPQSHLNPLWKKFWNIDRPIKPSAADLAGIAGAMGFEVNLEEWQDETWGRRVQMPEAERIRYARIRLCLQEDRDAEVGAALSELGDEPPHEVATLWWDTSA